MHAILASVRPVVMHAKDVSIVDDQIGAFVDSISPHELEQSEYDRGMLLDLKEEHVVGFCFVYQALNFCFWGDPKWTIAFEGKQHDGSYGLARSLIRAYREGYPILEPSYLQLLSEQDARAIFRGNVEIPLFTERVRILRDLGRIVLQEFGGVWLDILRRADFDAESIVRLLVDRFPSIFRDEASYEGQIVKFYKRAQLVPGYFTPDLRKIGAISFTITGMEHLTAFADYKIPQLLRKFGILRYASRLADNIDSLVEIPEGSAQEIEIRAATIEAVERIVHDAQKRYPGINAATVDAILWFRGQVKSPDDKPYHRTRTIWY